MKYCWYMHVHIFRNPHDIHIMMDDIQEQNEIASEITEIISQPFGNAQEIDDVRMYIYHEK